MQSKKMNIEVMLAEKVYDKLFVDVESLEYYRFFTEEHLNALRDVLSKIKTTTTKPDDKIDPETKAAEMNEYKININWDHVMNVVLLRSILSLWGIKKDQIISYAEEIGSYKNLINKKDKIFEILSNLTSNQEGFNRFLKLVFNSDKLDYDLYKKSYFYYDFSLDSHQVRGKQLRFASLAYNLNKMNWKKGLRRFRGFNHFSNLDFEKLWRIICGYNEEEIGEVIEKKQVEKLELIIYVESNSFILGPLGILLKKRKEDTDDLFVEKKMIDLIKIATALNLLSEKNFRLFMENMQIPENLQPLFNKINSLPKFRHFLLTNFSVNELLDILNNLIRKSRIRVNETSLQEGYILVSNYGITFIEKEVYNLKKLFNWIKNKVPMDHLKILLNKKYDGDIENKIYQAIFGDPLFLYGDVISKTNLIYLLKEMGFFNLENAEETELLNLFLLYFGFFKIHKPQQNDPVSNLEKSYRKIKNDVVNRIKMDDIDKIQSLGCKIDEILNILKEFYFDKSNTKLQDMLDSLRQSFIPKISLKKNQGIEIDFTYMLKDAGLGGLTPPEKQSSMKSYEDFIVKFIGNQSTCIDDKTSRSFIEQHLKLKEDPHYKSYIDLLIFFNQQDIKKLLDDKSKKTMGVYCGAFRALGQFIEKNITIRNIFKNIFNKDRLFFNISSGNSFDIVLDKIIALRNKFDHFKKGFKIEMGDIREYLENIEKWIGILRYRNNFPIMIRLTELIENKYGVKYYEAESIRGDENIRIISKQILNLSKLYYVFYEKSGVVLVEPPLMEAGEN